MSLDQVVAKMHCNTIETVRWGSHETQVNHKIRLGAICSNKGEDKAFTDATPSGECWMTIKEGFPAAQFFKPGKRYYVTFTEAPD